MRGAGRLLRFVLFEPAGNIQHFGDVVAGAAADAVRFFRNTYENGIHVQEFERFVELFGFGNGSAIVGLAGHDECGGLDFGDEIGERALHVIVGVVPGKTGEPVFGNERNVGGESEAVPIDARVERSSSAETVSVLDGPAGEHTAAASAGDEEIVGVDVALGDDRVDAAVEVVEIVAGIGVMDEIGKILAVASASAGGYVENHVPSAAHHLFFQIDTVTVVAERTAVNFKNKGIFLGSIEIRRMNHPALDL